MSSDNSPGGDRESRLRERLLALQTERNELAARLESVVRIAERTRTAAERMRDELISMRSSKFWKLRDAWFAFKARAGISRIKAERPVDMVLERIESAAGCGTGFDRWISRNDIRPAEAQLIESTIAVLPRLPTISILVPVYDTPERYLRAALESVLEQLYPHWELCVADDASTEPHVRAIIAEYAMRDGRVKPVLRDRNGGISEASNSALALATGEFVALLDSDDLLTRDALFHVALALNRYPDADFIYTDEDKIDDDDQRSEPYFKPDWSPDSLLARMYTGHLGVFRRALVTELGGFRAAFTGSQDYDLVLRVTERAQRIHHIPRVLYHWRIHAASAAGEAGSKGYAYVAGQRALEEALARRGEPGRVEQLPQLGSYTVRYALQRPEKIGIIVPTRDHGEDVERCLTSIFAYATYPDFEVLLVDNGSTDPASLATFARWSAAEPRVRVLRYDVPFNFAAINNYAARHTGATYLLFLNNDTRVRDARLARSAGGTGAAAQHRRSRREAAVSRRHDPARRRRHRDRRRRRSRAQTCGRRRRRLFQHPADRQQLFRADRRVSHGPPGGVRARRGVRRSAGDRVQRRRPLLEAAGARSVQRLPSARRARARRVPQPRLRGHRR